jgi:hypothetical protein
MPDAEEKKTSIQITTGVRDRLYGLKFRKTYDEFLKELCSLYEEKEKEKEENE